MDSLLISVILLFTPKVDSLYLQAHDSFIYEMQRYDHSSKRSIEFSITTFNSDTIAVSTLVDSTHWKLEVDIGYCIDVINEPGLFYTLIYHELAHIYLDKRDRKFGKTIMNYSYIYIDLFNDSRSKKFIRKLMR